MQSYIINGVRSRKGAIRPSHLMPLNLLELECYHQQNKNLQRIKELHCTPPLHHLHFDVVKSAVAMFISEVVHRSIREEGQSDPALFGFLFHMIEALDVYHESLANFPPYFLLRLSKHLGFLPKGSYDEASTPVFALHEGAFMPAAVHAAETVAPPLSQWISQLLYSRLEDIHEKSIPPGERRRLLDTLIRYYHLHMISFGELKSPRVLHEVLSQ